MTDARAWRTGTPRQLHGGGRAFRARGACGGADGAGGADGILRSHPSGKVGHPLHDRVALEHRAIAPEAYSVCSASAVKFVDESPLVLKYELSITAVRSMAVRHRIFIKSEISYSFQFLLLVFWLRRTLDPKRAQVEFDPGPRTLRYS